MLHFSGNYFILFSRQTHIYILRLSLSYFGKSAQHLEITLVCATPRTEDGKPPP